MPYTKFCISIIGFHKMIFWSVIITNKFEDIKGAIEKDSQFNGYKNRYRTHAMIYKRLHGKQSPRTSLNSKGVSSCAPEEYSNLAPPVAYILQFKQNSQW